MELTNYLVLAAILFSIGAATKQRSAKHAAAKPV